MDDRVPDESSIKETEDKNPEGYEETLKRIRDAKEAINNLHLRPPSSNLSSDELEAMFTSDLDKANLAKNVLDAPWCAYKLSIVGPEEEDCDISSDGDFVVTVDRETEADDEKGDQLDQ